MKDEVQTREFPSRFILLPSSFILVLLALVGAVTGSPLLMGVVLAGMANVGAVGTAFIASRLLWPEATGTERVVAVGVLATGVVVVSSFVLAHLGLLTLEYQIFVLMAALLALAAFVRTRTSAPWSVPTQPDNSLGRLGVALMMGLAASVLVPMVCLAWPLAAGELPSPLVGTWADSHHGLALLSTATEWMKSQWMRPVDLPFTSAVATYEPPGAALVHLWFLLPFHTAVAARFAQLPFALLAAAALAGIGKAWGLRPPARLLAPLVWLCLPAVLGASFLPGSVLVATALTLAAVDALLAFGRQGRSGALVVAGLALGLLLVIGYESLGYVPVVVAAGAIVLAAGRKHLRRCPAALAAAALAAVAGLAPYVYNTMRTGNPVYPMKLRLGTWTICDGPYAWRDPKALYGAWSIQEPAPVLARVATDVGLPLALLAIVGLAVGWPARGPKPWGLPPAAVMSLLGGLHILAVWALDLGVKHALPAVAIGLVGLARLVPVARVWSVIAWGTVLAAVAVTMCVPFVRGRPGEGWTWPMDLPAGAWLAGLPAGLVVAGFLWRRLRILSAAISGAVLCGALAANVLGWLDLAHALLPASAPGPDGPLLREAWEELASRLERRDRVACAGPVVPFRLHGRGLRAYVCYAPPSGNQLWLLHDYDREFRSKGALGNKRPPRHLERMGLDPQPWLSRRWLVTLAAFQVRWLVVARLPAEAVHMYDGGVSRFPRERRWAEWAAHRIGCFKRVWANKAVRIYRFDPVALESYLRASPGR